VCCVPLNGDAVSIMTSMYSAERRACVKTNPSTPADFYGRARWNPKIIPPNLIEKKENYSVSVCTRNKSGRRRGMRGEARTFYQLRHHNI
jgi:hypothetical protein